MMAHTKLNDIIPILIKKINIDSILLQKGYTYAPEKNVDNLLHFTKQTKKFSENIYIGYIDGIQHFYSPTYKDQGNIITFIMNRVDKDPDYNDEKGTFNPYQNNLVETIKILKILLIEKELKKTKLEYNNISSIDFDNTLSNFFTLSFYAKPLFYYDFLEKENIQKDTANYYLFENKIFNVKNMVSNKETDPYLLCFPLYLNNKECGLQFSGTIAGPNLKKKDIDIYASNSNKSGIWYSNRMKLVKLEKEIICIVSNPKEALAHYQYFKKDRSYICLNELDAISIKALKNRVNRRNYEFHLALNSEIKEISKEIKIIINFHKELQGYTFIQETDKYLTIKLVESNISIFKKFLNQIKEFNDFIVKNSIDTLGDWSKVYVSDSIIKLNKMPDGSFIIKIPQNKKSLFYFTRIMTRLYTKNVKLEKPKYTSWTNQLVFDQENNNNYSEKLEKELIYQ